MRRFNNFNNSYLVETIFKGLSLQNSSQKNKNQLLMESRKPIPGVFGACLLRYSEMKEINKIFELQSLHVLFGMRKRQIAILLFDSTCPLSPSKNFKNKITSETNIILPSKLNRIECKCQSQLFLQDQNPEIQTIQLEKQNLVTNKVVYNFLYYE